MFNSKPRLCSFKFSVSSVCKLSRQLILWPLFEMCLVWLPCRDLLSKSFLLSATVLLILKILNLCHFLISGGTNFLWAYSLNAKEAINKATLIVAFFFFFPLYLMQFFNEKLGFIPMSSVVIFIANIITDVRSLP